MNRFGDLTSQRERIRRYFFKCLNPNDFHTVRAIDVVPTHTYVISLSEFENVIRERTEPQFLLIRHEITKA